jgi:DNA (cytosine-5)-methyltransferase 1
MSKLKLLDLFSGIGGFSLGLESTGGFETIAFVEKDKFCQKVLKKHWSNINIEEDIRNVKGERYAADVITGGFPCQPFSVAGKRKGKDDDRYLWDETIRVIRECKPKWFVGENVEGIVNIANGTVLQQIQQDLEKEGFEVQCGIIPASGIGAWHQRKRVWIIGCNVSNSNYSGCKDRTKQHRWEQTQNEKRFDSFSRSNIISNSNSNRNTNEIERSNGEKEKVQREHRQEDSSAWKFIRTNSNDVPNTSSQRSSSQSIGVNRELEKEIKGKKETRNKSTFRTSSSCSDVPNTKSKGSFSSGRSNTSDNEQQRLDIDKERNWSKIRSKSSRCSEQTLPNTNSKGLQGCSLPTELEREQRQVITKRDTERQQTWWEAQSDICRNVNGISYELDKDRSNRIKALGNSIVPLIAREIGLAILEAEK